ncbi:hypothetical protein GG344DRAFT_71407 [Lentinula edodes]|nr:hypothetical protein GG344DRAFT_71407 [Lentinula edodes]
MPDPTSNSKPQQGDQSPEPTQSRARASSRKHQQSRSPSQPQSTGPSKRFHKAPKASPKPTGEEKKKRAICIISRQAFEIHIHILWNSVSENVAPETPSNIDIANFRQRTCQIDPGTIASGIAQVDDHSLQMTFSVISLFGVTKWHPDVLSASPTSLYNLTITLREALTAAHNSKAPAIAFYVSHFLREDLTAAHNSEPLPFLLMSATFLERPSLLPTTPSANFSPGYPLQAPTITSYVDHFLREALTAAHNSERPSLLLATPSANSSPGYPLQAPTITSYVDHFLREAPTAAHNSEAPTIAFHVVHFLREAHSCPQLRVPILCLTILYKPSFHISYFFNDALTAACNSECKVFL